MNIFLKKKFWGTRDYINYNAKFYKGEEKTKHWHYFKNVYLHKYIMQVPKVFLTHLCKELHLYYEEQRCLKGEVHGLELYM